MLLNMLLSESNVDQDRRIFERFVSKYPARFKNNAEDFGITVFLRNISGSGAKLICRERLNLFDSIAVEVKLPDGKPPLLLQGKVVWIKSKESSYLWEIGVKFHEIRLMHLSRIFDLLPEN